MSKLFLAFLMVLYAIDAFPAIGTITDVVNNPAAIQRNKDTLDGKKGIGIEMMDTVRTVQGKVGITFQDETKVQITENSKLVIDDFVYDPNSNKGGKLAVKVALGTVRYASGQIAKNSPQNVAVVTPTATIGVRGTDFTTTVDEIGRSTIILLPSCPSDWKVLERDCKVGEILVTNETGTIILNQPFQATRVESIRSKLGSVILKLNESDINNILILSPPKEFGRKKDESHTVQANALDVDFLKEMSLVNELDKKQAEIWTDRLSNNFLDQQYLVNVLDLVNSQMQAQLDLLNNTKAGLLPDYNALTNVKVIVDDPRTVELCRDDGSNVVCIQTPYNQASTVIMVQGNVEVKNRINSGNNTFITIRQSN